MLYSIQSKFKFWIQVGAPFQYSKSTENGDRVLSQSPRSANASLKSSVSQGCEIKKKGKINALNTHSCVEIQYLIRITTESV